MEDKSPNIPSDDRVGNLAGVAKTWKQFAEDTTFHGVRYIFGTGMVFRKFAWFLCVSTSISLFVLQVVLRTGVYFDYNTNIDIEMVYSDKIGFPAVTICNENMFRLTEADRSAVYNMLYGIYTNKVADEQELQALYPDFAGEDMNIILNTTKHEQEDFFVACQWLNEPCDPMTLFTPTVTDMGVCYTFNGVEKDSEAMRAGSMNGLSLILNIETYQYMVGPKTEIGVKVLLHDDSEVPLMNNLAFAVGPGTHAIVGITKTEEFFMVDPYGQCVLDADPISTCTDKREGEKYAETCQCQSAFQTAVRNDSETSCNISKQYYCIEKKYKGEKIIPCPLPCNQTTYGYSLSQALLSQEHLQSRIFPNMTESEEKIGQLQRSVYNAQTVSHRIVPEVVTRDVKLFNDVKAMISAMGGLITETLSVMESEMYILSVNDVSSDVNTIFKRHLEEKHHAFETFAFTMVYTLIHQNFDKEFDYFQLLINELVNCLGNENRSDTESFLNENYFTDLCQMDPNIKYDSSQIVLDGLGIPMDNRFDKVRGLRVKYTGGIQILIKPYVNEINEVKHQQCLQQLEEYENAINFTKELYNKTFWLFKLNPNHLSEMSKLKDLKIDILHTIANTDIESTKEKLRSPFVDQPCAWPSNYSKNPQEVAKRQTARQALICSEETYKNASVLYDQILSSTRRMEVIFKKYILQYNRTINQYQDGYIQLDEIAKEISYANVQGILNDLRPVVNALSEHIHAYGTYESIVIKMQTAFEEMYSSQIVYGKRDFLMSNLWRKLISKSDIPEIVTVRQQFEAGETWPLNLKKVFDHFETPALHYPDEMGSSLSTIHLSFNNALMGLQIHLEAFLRDITITDRFFVNNFLEMDIFYKELKYQKVTQRPSFELLSLLSEVGGFLGLLLGASVLTVCEIVDYFILSIIARCKDLQIRREKQKNQEFQDNTGNTI